jgi:tRNA-2-methylthio-N6-dimethylallyladenosine synthase
MPTYYIWTIGCQMNKAESERLTARFEELGYKAAKSIQEADLVVLNSCVVRQSAEDRVINKLHDLKHLKKEKPDIVLALTGCMVDSANYIKNTPSSTSFLRQGNLRRGWKNRMRYRCPSAPHRVFT